MQEFVKYLKHHFPKKAKELDWQYELLVTGEDLNLDNWTAIITFPKGSQIYMAEIEDLMTLFEYSTPPKLDGKDLVHIQATLKTHFDTEYHEGRVFMLNLNVDNSHIVFVGPQKTYKYNILVIRRSLYENDMIYPEQLTQDDFLGDPKSTWVWEYEILN